MAKIYIKGDYRTKGFVRPQLRFRHNTHEKLYSLGLSIPSKFWNRATKNVEISTDFTQGAKIKQLLDDIVNDCNDILIDHRKKGKGHFELVAKEIEKYIHQKQFFAERNTVLDKYTEFVTMKSKEVSPLTIKKYNTFKSLLLEYEKKALKRSLIFTDFDKEFERVFKDFLNNFKGQLNNTVTKYIECLKIFLKWSYQKEYLRTKDFENYSTKRTKNTKDIVALNERELQQIIELDINEDSVQYEIRDLFVFMCMTGQRISDYKRLSWNDITKSSNTLTWNLYQKKGSKESKITIPIFGYALTVIDKKDVLKGTDQPLFNHLSEPVINREIKKICQNAGIIEIIKKVRYKGAERVEFTGPKSEFISCHSSRRTYTSICLNNGIGDDHITSVTGHENTRTLESYKSVFTDQRDAKLKTVWSKFG